jgi:hypothetical protein
MVEFHGYFMKLFVYFMVILFSLNFFQKSFGDHSFQRQCESLRPSSSLSGEVIAMFTLSWVKIGFFHLAVVRLDASR